MKRWLIICALAGLALLTQHQPVSAQVRQIGGTHQARLSGNCSAVDESDAVSLNIGDVRVRRGGQLKAAGVRQSIFVESGAFAEVKGVGSFVFVAKGGKATVGGMRNHIVAESGSSVVIVGSAVMTIVDTIELQVHQLASDCR